MEGASRELQGPRERVAYALSSKAAVDGYMVLRENLTTKLGGTRTRT